MDFNCEKIVKVLAYVLGIYVALRIIQDNCNIGLGPFFNSVENILGLSEGFSNIAASEGTNESIHQPVTGLGRTPSTCYPQPTLKAEDLLPKEDSAAIREFNIAKPAGEGIIDGVNLLDAGFHVGVNTVGQSLRNANQQLRSEPPNPQVGVSPWMTSTIGPDLSRKPLEDGEGCAAGAPLGGAPTAASAAAA